MRLPIKPALRFNAGGAVRASRPVPQDLHKLAFAPSVELAGAFQRADVMVRHEPTGERSIWFRALLDTNEKPLAEPKLVEIGRLPASAKIVGYRESTFCDRVVILRVAEKNVDYDFNVVTALHRGGAMNFKLHDDVGDIAALTLREVGHPWLSAPEVDGFRAGGVHQSQELTGLQTVGGRSVASLEKAMRPGALATSGFIGETEALVPLLVYDNETVTKTLRTTHQQLADPLLKIRGLAKMGDSVDPFELTYSGDQFRVKLKQWMGNQASPFNDGTASNLDLHVTKLRTGETLTFSGLLGDLVQRYGFYEGKETSYRVAPETIAAFFNLAPVAPKPWGTPR